MYPIQISLNPAPIIIAIHYKMLILATFKYVTH